MNRLPYEFVVSRAEEIFERAINAPDWEAMSYLERYFIFLKVCGWNDLDLYREMLRRIDLAWEAIVRNKNEIKRIGTALN